MLLELVTALMIFFINKKINQAVCLLSFVLRGNYFLIHVFIVCFFYCNKLFLKKVCMNL